MTALYGVLPPLMAWKLREQQEKEKEAGGVVQATTKLPKRQQMLSPAAASSSFSPPLLPGGRASLTALTTASVAVEVGRLAEDLEGDIREGREGADRPTVREALLDLERRTDVLRQIPTGMDCDIEFRNGVAQ